MQNLLFSPHILLFWEHFCQLSYFKMPTLVNSIQSNAPFTKYSTSIMFLLLASIFVKKFSQKFFRKFLKNAKMKFLFWPIGNWILTLPHICLFYPPKMRYYVKKLHNMYHACRITVIFNGFFVFAKISICGKIFAKFLWDFDKNFCNNRNFCVNLCKNEHFREKKFRKNCPIFAWFSHFRENWQMHFRFNPKNSNYFSLTVPQAMTFCAWSNRRQCPPSGYRGGCQIEHTITAKANGSWIYSSQL
jgi:hypothetical protein